MAMAFCRGCGKEIHDSAPLCPHCGAPQGKAYSNIERPSWMAIVCIILGVMAFLGSLHTPHDSDEKVGIGILMSASFILGALNLHQKKPGKTITIIGLTFTFLALLILPASFPH